MFKLWFYFVVLILVAGGNSKNETVDYQEKTLSIEEIE